MKKIFAGMLSILLGFGLLFADKLGDFDISYTTEKPLSGGNNNFIIKLTKDGNLVKGADITLKAIMPAMPNMPKMNIEAKANETAEAYESSVNIPHGGTWQLVFDVNIDGKKYTHKSSVSF